MRSTGWFERYWGWGLLAVFFTIVAATVFLIIAPEGWGTRIEQWALVVAALMMGWSAWQSRGAVFAMKEQTTRYILDEVVEWTTDVTKCERPVPTTIMVAMYDAEPDRQNRIDCEATSAHLSELASECAQMIVRGRYIGRIAYRFGRDFQGLIEKLRADLEKRIVLLRDCDEALRGAGDFSSAQKAAREHWLQTVIADTYKVLDSAANLRMGI